MTDTLQFPADADIETSLEAVEPALEQAAAALPQIKPERRKHLLQSISEAAATAPGWSSREPSFYPEWVEKEAA